MRAIFVDCTAELRETITRQALPVPSFLAVNDGNPSEAELAGLCRDAEVVLIEHTKLPPAVLDFCPNIRGIVFMGTGAGTYVDLADAQRRGIQVATTPGYGDRAVAEHALALMFAGARGIARMDRDIRTGRWQPRGGLQLGGRKLAVIGLGGIGATLADLAGALGMQVSAWNRSYRNHPAFEPDLGGVLSEADVVSLHLTLTEQTAALLDRPRLYLPKRGFLLVNTARAALIEETALLAALDDGQIGHAALDVFPDEPLPANNPYAGRDDVTLTAHAAYMTDDAYTALWAKSLEALAALLDGRAM
ncbi:MAG: glycerate dehydrogenase [Alphaproteobacteria bacterium]|jgi:D-3-phosphoglycerate dehydrogenase|nr:glycerate dehydrogenase [Alphaproteobacteria bacterium]